MLERELINLNIKTLVVGNLLENCYILNIDNDYLIIDPGDEAKTILNHIHGNLLGVLITHYHKDHYSALNDILKYKNVPVYDYKDADKEITISKFKFKVIAYPGHKEDLVGFLFDDKLFSGDFIFKGTIGRTDLPGGNFKEMQESIKKILAFKDELEIYPGHGQSTNLSNERKNLNSYL